MVAEKEMWEAVLWEGLLPHIYHSLEEQRKETQREQMAD